MRSLMVTVCLALGMQGCASTPGRTEFGAQALKSGDYTTAESYMRAAIQAGERPDINWFNLGLLYYQQSRQSAVTKEEMLGRAKEAFTISARYGFPQAQQTLRAWALPLPPVDLARRSPGANDMAAVLAVSALSIATKTPIQSTSSLPSVSCTSTHLGEDYIRTNCN